MTTLDAKLVTFAGLADHIDDHPVRLSLDIYQLSHHKVYIFYPAMTSESHWLFLADRDFVTGPASQGIEIRIRDDAGKQLGFVQFQGSENLGRADMPSSPTHSVPEPTLPGANASTLTRTTIYSTIAPDTRTIPLHFKLDFAVERPGRVSVELGKEGDFTEIGSVQFHHAPTPPLSPETILAIESDPKSAKAVRLKLGCMLCPSVLDVYTGLRRSPELEREGFQWQYELGEEFTCSCGGTSYSLKYIKESLHGLLQLDSVAYANVSFVRSYAHAQVIGKVAEYNVLLRKRRDEATFQAFIEENPIMLAQFGAKRIFIRPSILGKHKADFAILDSQNQLLLIELERPSLKLFKKDGHPTADLMHAYGQVRDWIQLHHKHPTAFLGEFGLSPEDVMAVKGVVIAGRMTAGIREALQRHLTDSPYPGVGFCTLDDLANSVVEISKTLA